MKKLMAPHPDKVGTLLQNTVLTLSMITVLCQLSAQTTVNTNNNSFSNDSKRNWEIKNPFEHKVFIENKGQFDKKDNIVNPTIRYAVANEGVEIYFTSRGLTYRHDEYKKPDAEEKEAVIYPEEKSSRSGRAREHREERGSKPISHYIHMDWIGANPDAPLIAEEPVTYYFTYPDMNDLSGKSSIKASAYKKIIYKNLYSNIDVEYTFPENKPGIKYTLILHPGANAADIKMKYENVETVSGDSDGNIVIKSSFGEFIDHAPKTFYANNYETISSSFTINDNVVSFSLPNGEGKGGASIIIDPWITNPAFAGYNAAYEVEYDLAGNVYVYGGGGALPNYQPQEIKFNNAGVIQWVYTTTFLLGAYNLFGDFAVDGASGSSYIVQGFNYQGAAAIKVNSLGLQVGLYPGTPLLNEMWRIVYNNCTKQAIIGGGGTRYPFQACILDTNLTIMTPVNIFSAVDTFLDVTLLALDNTNSCYMATASNYIHPTNMMVKCPASTLLPVDYIIQNNNHNFPEGFGAIYKGLSCGFNGMAVSNSFLYTYDGKLIQRWNKNTGILINSATISPTPYSWGGIAVDNCDNIYVGVQSFIIKYDTNFTVVSTIALPNTVYDLRLAPGNLLYACGLAFAASYNITGCDITCCPYIDLNLASTNSSCAGNNGTATTTPIGGATPYTYSWSSTPAQTTQTATGLAAGMYSVQVTDVSGCSKTDTVTVSNSSGILTVIASSSNVSCSGETDGSATAGGSGGTLPYTYLWNTSPSQTTATATGLNAGTYTVTITDVNGCNAFATVNITEPSPLIPIIYNITNNYCNGSNQGSATVFVSGGTNPFAYSWSPGAGTSSTATGLAAGNYTVTITDANGCTGTQTVAITQPSAITVTANSTANSCGSNNGTATANVTGGTSPYIYAWSNGQSASTATNLSAGSYSVLVTDTNNCTQTQTVTVASTSPPSASTTQINIQCFGQCTGSASASVSAGTSPYTFVWTNGQTTSAANNLCAGSYTVVVTDAVGCTDEQTGIITEPASALSAGMTSTPENCGSSNGTASATVSGGTSPYIYVWGNGQTASTATNLSAGNYSVLVTDANNCTQTQTVSVANLNGLAATMSQGDVLCYGQCTGNASVNIAGGTSPYTFLWSNSQTNSSVTGLCAQTYTLLVTDNNGCSSSQIISISEPAAIAASLSSTDATCGNSDGTATASPSGGTGAFTYLWNPSSQNTPSATGLPAGIYFVNVTDANGCGSTFSVTVNNANGPNVFLSQNNISCYGQCTGNGSVNVTGGTVPYTYLWTPGGQTTSAVNNLCAGNYILSVSDAGGCTFLQTVSITQPASGLSVSASGGTTIIIGGSAQLNSSGGTSYNWIPSTGLSCSNCPNPVAKPAVNTEYCVIATDANGCTDSACVSVLIDMECGSVYVPNAFSPNGDSENDLECVIGNCVVSMSFTIFNRWGEKVFETNDPKKCWDGTYHGQLENAGVYTYFMKANLISGEVVKKQGNISLVR